MNLARHRIGLNCYWIKMFLPSVQSAFLMTLVANPFLSHPAIASPDQNLEICRRAKALGYDESKEFSFMQEGFTKKDICTRRYWQLFQPKPLNQILNSAELSQYRQATEQGKCRRAESLLSEHFDVAHPDAPPHRSDDLLRYHWRLSIAKHFYPSLGLCRDLRTIRTSLKEIAREDIKARPFWSLRENFYVSSSMFPRPVQSMYGSIASLLRALHQTQSPKVAQALLHLSHEGQAVKFHPHYELYLAFRLHGFGAEDPLIDTVIGEPIDPTVRGRIAEKARLKNSTGIPMFPESP